MKYINISSSKYPVVNAIVDDDDYERCVNMTWHLGNRGYVVSTKKRHGKNTTILMHRFILNAPQGVQVDHINHNGLDNRKINLRLVTNAQNQYNTRPNRNREFKGVYENSKTKGKYESRIGFSGRAIYLGIYETVEEAALAYDVAARIIFGEYAAPNFDNSTVLQELVKLWSKNNINNLVKRQFPPINRKEPLHKMVDKAQGGKQRLLSDKELANYSHKELAEKGL